MLVGSQGLIDAYALFGAATDKYLREVSRQLNDDGIFRLVPARKDLKRYGAALDAYVIQTRRELGIRRSVDARNSRIFDESAGMQATRRRTKPQAKWGDCSVNLSRSLLAMACAIDRASRSLSLRMFPPTKVACHYDGRAHPQAERPNSPCTY